jgi:alpha,alpha-trehalase
MPVSWLILAVWLLGLLPIAWSRSPPTPAPWAPVDPAPPQVLFQDLFAAVQEAAIYSDQKTFPDAVPNSDPAEILARYHRLRPASPGELKRFTDAQFLVPESPGPVAVETDRPSIIAHIDTLWDPLTRNTPSAPRYSSLLALPAPYVVPGGRFREIYYWDSYFTMLGLDQSARHDLVVDMIRDFAFLIDTYGHVPNGTRTYYLSRSQPPFFFEMVGLLAQDDDPSAFAQYVPQLKREYAFWMEGSEGLHPGAAHRRVVALPDGSILNRYWDDLDTPRDESYLQDIELARRSARPPQRVLRDIRATAESGWDFSSRWFANARSRDTVETTRILPVDLNSLLFGLEIAIRKGCQARGDQGCAREFARRAAARHAAIDRYLWDPHMGAYLDYHWPQRMRIERLSAATLYPLFLGMASDPQASAVAAIVERDLLKAAGIVTTPLTTGEQWDAPNGWAPIQWIAVAGLRRYGKQSLAESIACRWTTNVVAVYGQTGKLVEKYDVMTTGRSGGGGEYPLQDGFGWTNGVTRKLLALYPNCSRR